MRSEDQVVIEAQEMSRNVAEFWLVGFPLVTTLAAEICMQPSIGSSGSCVHVGAVIYAGEEIK